jgi:hypothetical protein
MDSLPKTSALGIRHSIKEVLQSEIEASVVGSTTDSRAEVPGKRKPVIREQNNNNNNK